MQNVYLSRYSTPEQLIATPPQKDLGIVVTIPCFNEPDLVSSLESLRSCDLPSCGVEVIVLINHSETALDQVKMQNQDTFEQTTKWCLDHSKSKLVFKVFLKELPKKHAGVGLARKIAMDEAVRRFEQLNKSDGVIVCFDADSLCESNYLVEIEKHFSKHSKTPGCSIHFEHPLEGDLGDDIYQAITEYELFLRYYTHAQKFCNLPYAYETIGSSMAVRSSAYQKQGGMNRRKAGEDFYFLHKIIALGNFSELTSTKVIPSPRQSDRVPFGTGKAVNKWLEEKSLTTYAPQTFIDLKVFTDCIEELYQKDDLSGFIDSLPKPISSFLSQNNFEKSLNGIKKNSASTNTFIQQFYHWLDAFKVLKYVHYTRDEFYPNIPVLEAAKWLLKHMYNIDSKSEKEALLKFRKIDRTR